MKIREIYAKVCEYAPIGLSEEYCRTCGGRDNSGIMVETDRDITRVLVTLDLTVQCAEYAVANGYELIITHHPVIFDPIKSLDFVGNRALTITATHGIGVISAHINLDAAPEGIDYYFAKGLGAKRPKILTQVGDDPECGYGRMFVVDKTDPVSYRQYISETFGTDNVMLFGARDREIRRVASFCGAGVGKRELELCEEADAIVSSDFRHHIIAEAIGRGQVVFQLPHYSGENYGMKAFAAALNKKLEGIKTAFYGCSGY